MNPHRRNKTPLALAALLASLPFLSSHAQTPPATPPPALNNTTVYIPWTEFKALLDAKSTATVDPDLPPVDFLFSPATYEASIDQNKVKVTARVTVTSLSKKLVLVPLGPAASGLLNVTVEGQPASIVMRDNTIYALMETGAKKVEMTSEREITTINGTSRFDFPLLPSPIVSVSATLPGVGLDAKADGVPSKAVEKDGTTVLTASIKGGNMAAISWAIRAPEAPPLPPRVFANTLSLVTVERGGMHCRAEILYDVLQSGVDSFRIALPPGIDGIETSGTDLREATIVTEGNSRFIIATLKERKKGSVILTVDYLKPFPVEKPAEGKPGTPQVAPAIAAADLPLLSHPDVVAEKGSIGIDVPGGFEVSPKATGARRVDVKELHELLWDAAKSPILFGFTYEARGASLSLSMERHEELAVLVAMSDLCEVTTTYTPEGKCITKMMYVVRNNLKQFMSLKLPEGAEIWSTFVNDRPVTPSRSQTGSVLIPLVKSQSIDEDEYDDHGEPTSYSGKRDKRRSEPVSNGDQHVKLQRPRLEKVGLIDDEPVDLKPYDVEIVFISPAVKLEERGTIKAALPESDIPCGQIAWAIFMPRKYQLLDGEGNLRETASFSLPFRHFGEAEYIRQQAQAERAAQSIQESAKAAEALEAVDVSQKALAAIAKVAGVQPVRIEIPITGEIHRFEKFLAVDEAPQLTLTYRKKAE